MKSSNFNIQNDLVAKELVSLKEIKRIQQKYQDDDTKTLEDVLIEENLVSEWDIYSTLAERIKHEIIDFSVKKVPKEMYNVLPQAMVEEYGIVPISEENDRLVFATSNPLDYRIANIVSKYIKKRVRMVVATPTHIKEQQDIMFNSDQQAKMYDEAQEYIMSQMTADENSQEEVEDIEDQPIIKLVNKMFQDAVAMKVSDIHIEPQEHEMRIRFRIDGKLTEYTRVTKQLAPSIISRIKFISGMNIAEKRIPQDGRLHYNVNKTKIDMRVSDLPGVFGEKIVIRITTALGIKLELDSIGFLPENREKFETLLHANRGIILLSGATGSGKSTTLYTGLSQLNNDETNIITVENPVEMVIPGITQVNINEKAGLTFASVLRSILRQDPDIIMVGEIRDKETAEIAASAAITGHLVLSTIHTYNAASSVVRLIDMGVEKFMVSSSLLGVIAQKLVRKLCPYCRVPHKATESELGMLGMPLDSDVTIYEAKKGGCERCNGVGNKGRTAVHEIMIVDNNIKRAIHEDKTTEQINQIAIESGMISMKENLRRLLVDGIISFETYFDTVAEVYQDE
ncbi:MAG: GspE/PulE family protein [Acutalibacteraceae bacterium]|nr:GspE/PulE family protein [Acutalibacteraceae bacterium]